MKPGYYTEHFSHREMVSSQTAVRRGIKNEPDEDAKRNLQRLCEVLEKIRAQFGPIRVTSGYRSAALNAALSGSATNSLHKIGCAADIEPLKPDVKLKDIVSWIVEHEVELGIEEVVYEYGAWVHVGIADEGAQPGYERWMKFAETGYLEYDADDPRVTA